MRQFIVIYFREWKKNYIPMRAAALTYTFILSIVPAIAFCLYLLSRFIDLKSVQSDVKDFILKNLATGTGTHVTQYLDRFIANINFKKIGHVGLVGLLITSVLLLTAVEESMNHIWQVKQKKPIWKRVFILATFFIFGPLSYFISMSVSTYIAKYFPQFLIPANFAAILISTIFFTVIFSVIPNTKVLLQNAFYCGFATAVFLEVAKWAYTIYTKKYLFYNQVYGGLAALPLFLIWIYINWLIVLSCTQLNYVLQHPQESKK